MRSRRPSTSHGIVDQRLHFSREALVLGVLALVFLWLVVSLGQELYLDLQLAHQVAELRKSNAEMEAANQSYQRDIAASMAGAAAEEEARQNGYARPDERLYLIGSPAPDPSPWSPTPGPSSSPTSSPAARRPGPAASPRARAPARR
jgi:cell division protein FtsB